MKLSARKQRVRSARGGRSGRAGGWAAYGAEKMRRAGASHIGPEPPGMALFEI